MKTSETTRNMKHCFARILIHLLFIGLLSSAAISFVFPRDTTAEDVYPTGNPFQDVANVQTAINNNPGGIVRLKAGTFDFRLYASPSYPHGFGYIEIHDGVTLLGDRTDGNGDPVTMIKGGIVPVMVDSEEFTKIDGLWFDQSGFVSILAYRTANGLEVTNNKITDVIPLVVFDERFGVWFKTRVGIDLDGGSDPSSVTGDALIKGNRLDFSGIPIGPPPGGMIYHDDNGIAVCFTNVTVEISDNVVVGNNGEPIEIVQSFGTQNNYTVVRNTLEAFQNVAAPGEPARGVIKIDGNEGFTYCADNQITLLPGSNGTAFRLSSTETLSIPPPMVVEKNTVTMSSGLAAIKVGSWIGGPLAGAVIRNNHFSGGAQYGILSDNQDSNNNVFLGNNFATLNVSEYLVFLDDSTHDNVLVGFSGCAHGLVNDDGTNNEITGCGTIAGGIGPQVSDAVSDSTQAMAEELARLRNMTPEELMANFTGSPPLAPATPTPQGKLFRSWGKIKTAGE